MRRIVSSVLVAAGALAVATINGASAAETKVKLHLDWLFNGYHAPFVAAADKGWYRAAGLDYGPGSFGGLFSREDYISGRWWDDAFGSTYPARFFVCGYAFATVGLRRSVRFFGGLRLGAAGFRYSRQDGVCAIGPVFRFYGHQVLDELTRLSRHAFEGWRLFVKNAPH